MNLALSYVADVTFYHCVTERFTEASTNNGFAGTKTNVGELPTPINGSAWINDPSHTQPKLAKELWRVNP